MFHVRGRLCRNERTGLFTLCRGKVKRKRASKAKKRAPAYRARARHSRKRAPKRSAKRGCKVMALYMTPTGQRRWLCAQFGRGKKAGLKHSANFIPGSETPRGEYLKMQKNASGGRYGSREPFVVDRMSSAERDAAYIPASFYERSEQPMEARGRAAPSSFEPIWPGAFAPDVWEQMERGAPQRAQMSLFPKG